MGRDHRFRVVKLRHIVSRRIHMLQIRKGDVFMDRWHHTCSVSRPSDGLPTRCDLHTIALFLKVLHLALRALYVRWLL